MAPLVASGCQAMTSHTQMTATCMHSAHMLGAVQCWQASCTLLAATLGFGLCTSTPAAPAMAAMLSAPGGPQTEAIDVDTILQEERGRVEYSMGLQDNARRARLLAKYVLSPATVCSCSGSASTSCSTLMLLCIHKFLGS